MMMMENFQLFWEKSLALIGKSYMPLQALLEILRS
jgi:hypothetical protein